MQFSVLFLFITLLISAPYAFGMLAIDSLQQRILTENPSSRDSLGATPLMRAAQKGDLELCQILAPLSEVDAQDYFRRTALSIAATKGFLNIVRYFIPLSNVPSHACLLQEILRGKLDDDVMCIVLQLTLPYFKGESIKRALDVAIHSRSKSACKLLAAVSSLNDSNQFMCPLALAARKGYSEICRVLIECKAQVDSSWGIYNQSPLMLAVLQNQMESCQVLAVASDINKRDKLKKTALMHAAEQGFSEIALELLDHYARIDLVDKNGDTAFTLTARNGNRQLYELMVTKVKTLRKNCITLLCCLKKVGFEDPNDNLALREICRQFYGIGLEEGLLIPYLKRHMPCLSSLKAVLEIRNHDGFRACDYVGTIDRTLSAADSSAIAVNKESALPAGASLVAEHKEIALSLASSGCIALVNNTELLEVQNESLSHSDDIIARCESISVESKPFVKKEDLDSLRNEKGSLPAEVLFWTLPKKIVGTCLVLAILGLTSNRLLAKRGIVCLKNSSKNDFKVDMNRPVESD